MPASIPVSVAFGGLVEIEILLAALIGASLQMGPRLPAPAEALDAHGIENENVAPGPSFSLANKRPW